MRVRDEGFETRACDDGETCPVLGMCRRNILLG
jgi:hypothetical protein